MTSRRPARDALHLPGGRLRGRRASAPTVQQHQRSPASAAQTAFGATTAGGAHAAGRLDPRPGQRRRRDARAGQHRPGAVQSAVACVHWVSRRARPRLAQRRCGLASRATCCIPARWCSTTPSACRPPRRRTVHLLRLQRRLPARASRAARLRPTASSSGRSSRPSSSASSAACATRIPTWLNAGHADPALVPLARPKDYFFDGPIGVVGGPPRPPPTKWIFVDRAPRRSASSTPST